MFSLARDIECSQRIDHKNVPGNLKICVRNFGLGTGYYRCLTDLDLAFGGTKTTKESDSGVTTKVLSRAKLISSLCPVSLQAMMNLLTLGVTSMQWLRVAWASEHGRKLELERGVEGGKACRTAWTLERLSSAIEISNNSGDIINPKSDR